MMNLNKSKILLLTCLILFSGCTKRSEQKPVYYTGVIKCTVNPQWGDDKYYYVGEIVYEPNYIKFVDVNGKKQTISIQRYACVVTTN